MAEETQDNTASSRDWKAEREAINKQYDAQIKGLEAQLEKLRKESGNDFNPFTKADKKAKDAIKSLQGQIAKVKASKRDALSALEAEKYKGKMNADGSVLGGGSYAPKQTLEKEKEKEKKGTSEDGGDGTSSLENAPGAAAITGVVDTADPEQLKQIELNTGAANAFIKDKLNGGDGTTAQLQYLVDNAGEGESDKYKVGLTTYEDFWKEGGPTVASIVESLKKAGLKRADVEAYLKSKYYTGEHEKDWGDTVLNALETYYPTEEKPPLNEAIGAPDAKANKSALDRILEAESDIANRTHEEDEEIKAILESYNNNAEKLIDPHFIENMPTWVWQAAKEGVFGTYKVDKELKKQYDEIQDKIKSGELDEDNLSDTQKSIITQYDVANEQAKGGRSRYGYALVNQIGTALKNIGSALHKQDMTAVSDYDKIRTGKMSGALDRYNKKYADMADKDAQMVGADAETTQQIQQQLKRLYTDSRVKPYVTVLNAENKKILVDYIAKMGSSVDWKQLPGLFMGLMMYQDTGKVTDVVLDAAKAIGSVGANIVDMIL